MTAFLLVGWLAIAPSGPMGPVGPIGSTPVQTGPVGQSQTQSTPPATTTSQTQTPPDSGLTPDALARIRAGLSRDSTLKIEDGQMKIYVEVVAKWPTFAEYTKGYDFMNGPTGRGNPMSHQEFLNMVTPKEMYGSGGISAPEILVMALENYFGQKAISKGMKELQDAIAAHDQKKIDEIRKRIDAELAALRGGGGQ